MQLRHATTADNWHSIMREGLLVGKSQGKESVVWLHAPSKTHLALAHTQQRHGGSLAGVVILEVSVPRSWLRRAWVGLWKCYRDIPPARIRLLGTGAVFAASPVQEETQ